MWENVPPIKTQSSVGIHTVWSVCPHEETMHPWISKLHPAKILIRLHKCAGWAESKLSTHVPRNAFFLPLICIECIYSSVWARQQESLPQCFSPDNVRWNPCSDVLMYSTKAWMLSMLVQIFSRQHFIIFYIFFREKRFWHYNLHEISKLIL